MAASPAGKADRRPTGGAGGGAVAGEPPEEVLGVIHNDCYHRSEWERATGGMYGEV